MAEHTAVILVVGLTSELLEHAPRMRELAGRGRVQRLKPVLPAVTCSVQSSMLTGKLPGEHGIVGNGWYHRALAEVQFWKQSNHLVHGPKVWELARERDARVTCGKLFWWYNMHASVDASVTPRPMYKADGRKLPDIYTQPMGLRDQLQRELGTFPLFNFWGPTASIACSQWIAACAKAVYGEHRHHLSLVYLPHLDYPLQKLGPAHPSIPDEVRAIDAVVGDLMDYYQSQGVRVVIVSEYGIEAVDRPIHINRELRRRHLLQVRVEDGLDMLDPGGSIAFAVADHQVAHVYVNDPGRLDDVRSLCERIEGVERVLDRAAQAAMGIAHERSGDLLLVAEPGCWFTYYHWLEDRFAPDFARTVDIHRKPGYDPVELFVDPALRYHRMRIGWKLFKRKVLGMRQLLDVIPLDATLVKGSHGRVDQQPGHQPIVITGQPDLLDAGDEVPCTAMRDVMLRYLFE